MFIFYKCCQLWFQMSFCNFCKLLLRSFFANICKILFQIIFCKFYKLSLWIIFFCKLLFFHYFFGILCKFSFLYLFFLQILQQKKSTPFLANFQCVVWCQFLGKVWKLLFRIKLSFRILRLTTNIERRCYSACWCSRGWVSGIKCFHFCPCVVVILSLCTYIFVFMQLYFCARAPDRDVSHAAVSVMRETALFMSSSSYFWPALFSDLSGQGRFLFRDWRSPPTLF